MATKQSVNSLLKQVRRERKKRFNFDAKNRTAEFRDYQTRESRASTTLEKLLQKALDAGGVNPQLLTRLHEKDDVAAEKFQKTQEQKVLRHAKQLATKRKKSAKEMQSFLKKHFGKWRGNPVAIETAKIATDISGMSVTPGNGTIDEVDETKAPWNNTIKTVISGGSKSSYGEVALGIDYDFVLQSPVTGIAVVDTWLMLNGTYSLSASGRCTGTRVAGVTMEASVLVSQPIATNSHGEIPEQIPILNQEITAGCTSRSRSGVIDQEDFRVISSSGIPIVANLPAIVSVQLTIYCYASKHARAVIDAGNQPNFGLNVASTSLIVEY